MSYTFHCAISQCPALHTGLHHTQCFTLRSMPYPYLALCLGHSPHITCTLPSTRLVFLALHLVVPSTLSYPSQVLPSSYIVLLSAFFSRPFRSPLPLHFITEPIPTSKNRNTARLETSSDRLQTSRGRRFYLIAAFYKAPVSDLLLGRQYQRSVLRFENRQKI